MPKHRNKFKTIALGAASVAAVAIASIVVFAGPSSQAQDPSSIAVGPKPEPSITDRVQAIDVNSIAKPASVAANRPATSAATAAKRPPTPILLRRPMAPAKVQWANAKNQSARMKSARKSNGLAARLPKKQLDRTRLPVLVPREGMIDTTKTKMVSFGDAYALNMPQSKGIQVTMYGNRSFVKGDIGAVSARPVQRLAGVAEDIRISQMEDGWTATFSRFGVVYSLDVTCDDIKAPDCVTDGYIRQAIAQFDDVAMGAEAEAEAAKDAGQSSGPSAWLDGVSKTISNITKGQ